MAYSYVTYEGKDGTLTFSVPFPYLDQKHVHVETEDGAQPFQFLNAGMIQLASPIPLGKKLRVSRKTPVDETVAQFKDGSVLPADDLNLVTLSTLYIVQEIHVTAMYGLDVANGVDAKAQEALDKVDAAIVVALEAVDVKLTPILTGAQEILEDTEEVLSEVRRLLEEVHTLAVAVSQAKAAAEAAATQAGLAATSAQQSKQAVVTALENLLPDGTTEGQVPKWTNGKWQPGSVDAFPSGTKLVFVQSAAPTGWTKSTAHNDKALRIVSGAGGGSGGSLGFSEMFVAGVPISGTVGATTLTVAQMPSHSHSIPAYPQGSPWNSADNPQRTADLNTNAPRNTGSQGGNASHTHSLSGVTLDLSVQYVDAIVCTKD